MSELKMYVAIGDYEAHWLLAENKAVASALLTDWIIHESGMGKDEWLDQLAEDDGEAGDWNWKTLGPDEQVEHEDGRLQTVREWATGNGRCHLAWGEVG